LQHWNLLSKHGVGSAQFVKLSQIGSVLIKQRSVLDGRVPDNYMLPLKLVFQFVNSGSQLGFFLGVLKRKVVLDKQQITLGLLKKCEL
jgi:hypothetical protein